MGKHPCFSVASHVFFWGVCGQPRGTVGSLRTGSPGDRQPQKSLSFCDPAVPFSAGSHLNGK